MVESSFRPVCRVQCNEEVHAPYATRVVTSCRWRCLHQRLTDCPIDHLPPFSSASDRRRSHLPPSFSPSPSLIPDWGDCDKRDTAAGGGTKIADDRQREKHILQLRRTASAAPSFPPLTSELQLSTAAKGRAGIRGVSSEPSRVGFELTRKHI